MTPPSENQETQLPLSEKDEPFSQEETDTLEMVAEKGKERSLARQFKLGSNLLYVCTGLMAGCVLLSLFSLESEMLDKGFDAFRLIIMTVLGYVFGAGKAGKED